jgi:hypothetical protein
VLKSRSLSGSGALRWFLEGLLGQRRHGAADNVRQRSALNWVATGVRGVWQPRFWEHTIRDEDDFENHFDYAHDDPVKHGLVQFPYLWPHSSFHRWAQAGGYTNDWCCTPDALPRSFALWLRGGSIRRCNEWSRQR